MAEILARISANGKIELTKDGTAIIAEAGEFSPHDAAFLARAMMACAAALSGPMPPKPGQLGGDAHLPVMKWAVGTSTVNGDPALVITIPTGIELTFVMPKVVAIDLGAALSQAGLGTAPLGGASGTVH